MKKLGIWLILGLAIRLLLIPITLHPDFRAVNLAAYFIAQKGEVLTFYDFLSKLPRSDHLVQLYGDNLFIYPPLAYLTHAVFNKAFYWAYPQTAFWTLINDIGQLRHTSGFTLLMYWLKLPYLIVDILCLILLLRNKFSTLNSQFSILILWWFNPVVIYTCYLMGQFDIFISLFILLALVFSEKKPLLSSVFLGLGAGFKPFPLLLLLLLPGNKIKNLIFGFGTYFLIIAPWLGSPAFKQYALLASQSDKIFFANIPISGSQYLPLFLLGLIVIYWWNYYHPKAIPQWAWLAAPLILFYSVTHYHPQWFIWVMPLLVVGVISQARLIYPYAIMLLAHFTTVLFFEPSLNFGLFGYNYWINPIINRFFSVDLVASITRAVLAGSGSVFIFPHTGKNA